MTGNSNIKERFFGSVDRSGDCWEWTGLRNRDGYGRFCIGRSTSYLAHRVSYELANGSIPPGKIICHTCDNPPCVNPEHLYAGTPKQNTADAIRRGRFPMGDTHPHTKLSDEQVGGVLAALKFGFDGRSVARIFGVSKSLVSGIKIGKFRSSAQKEHCNAD